MAVKLSVTVVTGRACAHPTPVAANPQCTFTPPIYRTITWGRCLTLYPLELNLPGLGTRLSWLNTCLFFPVYALTMRPVSLPANLGPGSGEKVCVFYDNEQRRESHQRTQESFQASTKYSVPLSIRSIRLFPKTQRPNS